MIKSIPSKGWNITATAKNGGKQIKAIHRSGKIKINQESFQNIIQHTSIESPRGHGEVWYTFTNQNNPDYASVTRNGETFIAKLNPKTPYSRPYGLEKAQILEPESLRKMFVNTTSANIEELKTLAAKNSYK